MCDQDAVDIMCKEAIHAIVDLEHMGLPFDRLPDGRISQRRFGGHTNNETKKAVMRACHPPARRSVATSAPSTTSVARSRARASTPSSKKLPAATMAAAR
ncbi:MAG TPA: FAD-binding protein [Microthrixaceae bacterium]|nr:FAD-binding protein [Microthrixaceae bacterium]